MGIVMPSQTNGWQAVLSKMFYAKGAQVWYIDNNFVFRLTFRLGLVPLYAIKILFICKQYLPKNQLYQLNKDKNMKIIFIFNTYLICTESLIFI